MQNIFSSGRSYQISSGRSYHISSVHLVGRDIRTTTGNNLHLVKDLTGLDPWSCTSRQVKKVLRERLSDAPEQDQWRVPYLGKLLELRGELHHQMMDTAELTELIESLCEN